MDFHSLAAAHLSAAGSSRVPLDEDRYYRDCADFASLPTRAIARLALVATRLAAFAALGRGGPTLPPPSRSVLR